MHEQCGIVIIHKDSNFRVESRVRFGGSKRNASHNELCPAFCPYSRNRYC
jgi:hypothetical protein